MDQVKIETVSIYPGKCKAREKDITVKGFVGTWYVIEYADFRGVRLCLLEHEVYGDETAPIIVQDTGDGYDLVLADAWNGFNDLEEAIEGEDIVFSNGKVYVLPSDRVVCRKTVKEATLRRRVYSLVGEFLDEAMDSESASKIRDLIIDDVVTDIRETSAWGEFSYDDMCMAIGRTLCKRLGIQED